MKHALLQKLQSVNGTVIPIALMASAIVGFIAAISLFILPIAQGPLTDMRLEPVSKSVSVGDTFTVDVVVQSSIPVNVFAGDLVFDHTTLAVQSIDYNTSIADLWAKKPWYSNGDGVINFIGGTTRAGGFIGTDRLIRVTFKALASGDGTLSIAHAQILQHDGLGTEAALQAPIDALFTVSASATPATDNNLMHAAAPKSSYTVVTKPPSPDLNGDGSVDIKDASIMLLHIGSHDMRFDLDQDGSVGLSDLSRILGE